MSDNNAHPGVRSLLAKFETSQSPITSPPSRGRSPASSDTPGSTRPLSRVRASFVTVDGVVQSSNPGSPLRKTSGRSDTSSMFGPQINQEDVEARRQNVISPTPGSLGDSQNGALGQDAAGVHAEEPMKLVAEPKVTAIEESLPSRKEKAPTKTQESSINVQPSTSSQASSDKAGSKVVTKRPSNINGTRNNATSKPAPAAASTSTKSSTDNTAPKQLSAREVAKERSNAIAHKSSRASLNPGAKTSARTNRGPTPSKELSATSPTNVPGSKPRTKSPTKPARLPASATAPTQASSARLGPGSSSSGRTSTTASTLARKPSSLKSAGAGQTKTSTSAAGVRRQSSRPSLPVQTAQERPSSRTSDVGSTRPLNEGFLARMMRPTESSRSKTHDKPDAKPAPKSTTVAAPRLSTAKLATTQPKAKVAASKPQSEKPQVAKVEPVPQKDDDKPEQTKQESEENNEASSAVIPEEPVAEESIAEEPENVTVEQPEPEALEVPAVVDNADEPVKSVEGEVAATEPGQVVESTESAEKVAAENPAETSVETVTKTDDDVLESNERTDTEGPVEATQQATETPPDPAVKEEKSALAHADDREQATTEPASEQTKVEPDEAAPSVTDDSTPAIEEKETPKAEQETSEILEASLVAEPAAEAEKDALVPEPLVQDVDEEVTEPNDAAVREPTETLTSEETLADKNSETVDVDGVSLTLN